MKQIAVLYICTGPYSKLFKDFYDSANKHFLVGKAELTFYVWTDSDEFKNWPSVKVFPHKYLGFPLDSLLRFEMFMEAKEELAGYDYIYFFNANSLFLEDVGEELLPDDKNDLLCRVWGVSSKKILGISLGNPMFFSYEKDRRSTAYIPPHKGPYLHYSGGINGGTAKAYMMMVEVLAKNVREDYDRGIIAEAHDQSHLNHYFYYNKCQIITPQYSMPGEFVKDGDRPKVIFRKKTDAEFNKKVEKNRWQHIKSYYRYLFRGIAWQLGISVKSGEEKYIR